MSYFLKVLNLLIWLVFSNWQGWCNWLLLLKNNKYLNFIVGFKNHCFPGTSYIPPIQINQFLNHETNHFYFIFEQEKTLKSKQISDQKNTIKTEVVKESILRYINIYKLIKWTFNIWNLYENRNKTKCS